MEMIRNVQPYNGLDQDGREEARNNMDIELSNLASSRRVFTPWHLPLAARGSLTILELIRKIEQTNKNDDSIGAERIEHYSQIANILIKGREGGGEIGDSELEVKWANEAVCYNNIACETAKMKLYEYQDIYFDYAIQSGGV